tara:strand:+ start:538 stop:714 length:177 start_codon:yes stop_codon:yes gene_type:complete
MKVISQENKVTIVFEYKYGENKEDIIDIFKKRYSGKEIILTDLTANKNKYRVKLEILL